MIAAIKNVLSPISEAKIIDAERRNPSSTMIDCRFIVIVFLLNVVVIRSIIEQSSQKVMNSFFRIPIFPHKHIGTFLFIQSRVTACSSVCFCFARVVLLLLLLL